jgi:hypothetical protein
MKKKLLIAAAVVVVLIVAGLVSLFIFLDAIVKKGVETVGPKVTQVAVTLDGASISPFSGKGELTGLFVGNPEGYNSESAIRMGTISVAVKPGSLMSDKMIVDSVLVEAPEITFEGGLRGSNLKKILDNVNEFSGETDEETPGADDRGGKKIQVNDLRISGGKISVRLSDLGGAGTTVPLPEIHLTDLGAGEEGITTGELIKIVLDKVLEEAIPAATAAVGDLGKQGTEQIQKGAEQLKDTTKSITDMFKKNE